MTKIETVDKKSAIRNKKYLLDERVRLMFLSSMNGFTFSDIAIIFNVNRSVITRLMQENMEQYRTFLIEAEKSMKNS